MEGMACQDGCPDAAAAPYAVNKQSSPSQKRSHHPAAEHTTEGQKETQQDGQQWKDDSEEPRVYAHDAEGAVGL